MKSKRTAAYYEALPYTIILRKDTEGAGDPIPEPGPDSVPSGK
jgi:hypothetical protein